MEINNQYDFFKNILVDTDGSLVVSGSDAIASTNSLSDVLTVGNETNGNSIRLTDGDRIENSTNSNNGIGIEQDQLFIYSSIGGNDYSELGMSINSTYLQVSSTTDDSILTISPDSITLNTITLLLSNLPTSDPAITDAIYRSGSFLMISNG